MKNQDAVLKLAVATLDYSRDGLARVILSKILTAATDVRNKRKQTWQGLKNQIISDKTIFSGRGLEDSWLNKHLNLDAIPKREVSVKHFVTFWKVQYKMVKSCTHRW